MDKPFPRVEGLLNTSVLTKEQLEKSLLNFLGYIDSPVGRKAYPKLIECVDYVQEQVQQAMQDLGLDGSEYPFIPYLGGDDSCPSCGCHPGDGITESCNDAAGCGYFKSWKESHVS
jgi:hypothetical protein